MIITLTTDFGLSDPFVGIMKGVILGIAPDVQIVDITHDIPSYDIAEATFVIDQSYRFFPAGTIHIVVVDPGVGSSRRPIATRAKDHCFVAPDNGVLSCVLGEEPVYSISNESLFRTPVSRTFHGRDIFAPTGAHLARGTPLASVGDRIVDFVKSPFPRPRPQDPNGLLATVLRIDKFGNIITNLRKEDLRRDFAIQLAGTHVHQLRQSFAEAAPNEVFAIEGSTGYIEIAMNQASAAERFRVARGTEIEVRFV